jgi:thiol-disulfide isomerase/thioredoxin
MIKKILFYTILIFVCLIHVHNANAQTPYVISTDDQTGSRIYKGSINKYTLQNDSTFSWYARSVQDYEPDANLIAIIERKKAGLHFIVFGGTWCDDSQYIMPRFFKLTEKAGISDSAICLFGVDRNKQTISNFSSAFGVTRVPTIIAMMDGKEIGRVVEYGTTGKWDLELVEWIEKK